MKLYLHDDTSFWGLLIWLLGFFPNKVIFEILRVRSLATGFGGINTAINSALEPLTCNGNSVLGSLTCQEVQIM